MSPQKKITKVDEDPNIISESRIRVTTIFSVLAMSGTIFCGGIAWATTSRGVDENKASIKKQEGDIEKRWQNQKEINRKFEALFVQHDDRMDQDDLEDQLEEKDIKQMAEDLSEIKRLFKKFVEEKDKSE